MMNIASSVPSKVSGLSGLVRAETGNPGQHKNRTGVALRRSVRDVRGKFNSPIYTRTRVKRRKQRGSKNLLGTLNYPGHPGQKEKAFEIVSFLLSWKANFPRTLPGHPGQVEAA